MRFTFRQREILRLLSSGHSSKEIADSLELTVGSVSRHLRMIQGKAGLQSRDQMIVYIFQNPQCLHKKGQSSVGLHAPSQTCPCCYCQALRVAG